MTSLPDDAFNPIGVALDATEGKVYWTASGALPDRNWRVQRANLDGSGAESVVVSPFFDDVSYDIVFVPDVDAAVIVEIDVEPRSINPRSRGVISVAVLTSEIRGRDHRVAPAASRRMTGSASCTKHSAPT